MSMTNYHAVMVDETGCEFGVDISAPSRRAAYARLREDYVESRCVQLESPRDTARREKAMYDRIIAEYWGEADPHDWDD